MVVPFGVDTEVFSPQKVVSPFKPGDFILGSIKSLEKIYNVDVLIKSYALLVPKFPFLKLLIAGEGAEEKKLKELAEKLGVSDGILFTGRIPFKDISKQYNSIDVLVNISEYESFGVSVIEAMACEKVVVVTNVGGLKDIVENDALGLKVNVGDVEQTAAALESLIVDKTKYQTIAANARKHVLANYSWENSLQQMLSIYEGAVAAK
jgi:glycosyltransferase involved in cell wall biosynthesis